MNRRTKVVATLGPATDNPAVLRRLLQAGADVVRINFSHGHHDDHRRRAQAVREIARDLKLDVAILGDLQGPKIRIEGFREGPVELNEGATFFLDTALGASDGDVNGVGCAYRELPQDVKAGDTLLLNDGAIALRVDGVSGTRIQTTVAVGGTLSDRKGINRQGGGLSAAALTDKDREDITLAVELEIDFLAVSFPRVPDDLHEARRLLKAAGGRAAIVAKIERAEALQNLEALIMACEAVMVARGDLGVEIGDAELPGWQKRIIRLAREKNRMVITATQMMESMIHSPVPTRAEVLDVANAVLDGTDAVMLSAETATGRYPVKVIEAITRVCAGAETHLRAPRPRPRASVLAQHFERTDEAIARAVSYTAQHMRADAILALTESGTTALLMSRTELHIPIYALTSAESARRRMALCRGVYPIPFLPSPNETATRIDEAIVCLRARGAIKPGDRCIATNGDIVGPGGTNTMKIVHIQ